MRSKANKIYMAEYESRNFQFSGFGRNAREAMNGLRSAIARHTKEYELSRGWYSKDDFYVTSYKIGEPYRDGCLVE